jgi:hypothetical protein
MPVIHDFNNSLDKSHKAEELPIREDLYRSFFGELFASVSHYPKDGQRQGLDACVLTPNLHSILISEKVRPKEPYRDIALEYWSDLEKGTKGWICTTIIPHYICYVVLALGIGYLLPVVQTRIAWAKNRRDWVAASKIRGSGFTHIVAHNKDRKTGREWTTVSVGVPPAILFGHVIGAMRSTFPPLHPNE